MSETNKSRRRFLTLSTAIGLSGLYGGYAHFVDPLVTPTLVDRHSSSFDNHGGRPPRASREAAERWLASQPWAARAAYQIQTKDAFVYFEDWKQTDSDEAVRLRPFALIWMTESEDGTAEPIRISCDSAYLKFESEFSMPNASPGRVIGGALEGKVRIQGKDGLDVVGKNFVFSEDAMRVWSDNEVNFAHGPHRGHALGLQAELIPDESAEPDEAVAISGLKSVKLRRNVVMDLQLGEQLPSSAAESQAVDDKPQSTTPVRIRCDGSFSFVTETNVATYEDKVRVLRPVGPDEYDSLECDTLTLHFEPEQSSEATPPTVAEAEAKQPAEDSSDFSGISGKLSFRRMLAVGNKVVLVSKTNNMQSAMDQLEYDATERVVILTDEKQVRVWQGNSILHAPEITLTQDEEGAADSIVCRGNGQLTYRDEKTGEVQLHARWLKQLRKYPDDKSDLDVIELEKEAVVSQPMDQSRLDADVIKLWVQPQETGAGKKDQAEKEEEPRSVPIERLQASKNVAMMSPDMHAVTELLQVWFQPAVLPPKSPSTIIRQAAYRNQPTPVSSSTPVNSNVPVGSSAPARQTAPPLPVTATDTPAPPNIPPQPRKTQTPVPGVTAQPSTAGQGPSTPIDPQKSKMPIVVASDLIQVRILHDSKSQQSRPAEIRTFGHVEVTQQTKPGEAPLRILGDRLHMENKSEADQVVHVFGAPAHVRDQQMHIQGNNIHLDRTGNNAWVDGEGLLQLPVNNDLDGKPLDTPQVLDIRWQKKMTFDGEQARFRGEVQADIQQIHMGIREQSRMRSQEMDVQLTEQISFAETNRRQLDSDEESDIGINLITCRGGVNVESHKDDGQHQLEIRRAQFRELALNQQTGRQLATGPGSIAIWRKPEEGNAGLPAVASVRANEPLKTETTDWEYSRIDFAGKSDGNMKQRFTTFYDRVEIVHGPIEKLLDTIDPDELPDNGGWMKCAKLTLTHYPATKTQQAYLKMLGTGNAELEGKMPARKRGGSRGENFRARADDISFDQSKQLYILRSHGNRMATIWRQQQPGADPSQHDAKRLEFIPLLNQLKSDRTVGTIGTIE